MWSLPWRKDALLPSSFPSYNAAEAMKACCPWHVSDPGTHQTMLFGWDQCQMPPAMYMLQNQWECTHKIWLDVECMDRADVFSQARVLWKHCPQMQYPACCFFPDGENFQSTPNGVLTAHTEWLQGVQLKHSVPPMLMHRELRGMVVVRLS